MIFHREFIYYKLHDEYFYECEVSSFVLPPREERILDTGLRWQVEFFDQLNIV
jgi:hypothetical protein